jgi:hypothetical protein
LSEERTKDEERTKERLIARRAQAFDAWRARGDAMDFEYRLDKTDLDARADVMTRSGGSISASI